MVGRREERGEQPVDPLTLALEGYDTALRGEYDPTALHVAFGRVLQASLSRKGIKPNDAYRQLYSFAERAYQRAESVGDEETSGAFSNQMAIFKQTVEFLERPPAQERRAPRRTRDRKG